MNIDKNKVNVAVLGCGTVGGSVARILVEDKAKLLKRNPVELNLKYIVDINFTYAQKLGLSASLFCKDLEVVLKDPEVSIVVELVGGTTLAKDFTEKALKAKKHVVTANKALLAHHGAELMALARENGVTIAFEASCAGGIPIVRALNDGLISNEINALYGIVNGTCNYILTSMTTRGIAYEDALTEAQADGLAEADPTLDVEGGDSAHKLAILSSLASGQKIDFDAIPVEGINNLSLQDVSYGEELGYVVKLLAIMQRKNEEYILCVRPAFISKDHPLAWVSGPFNAVSVYGHVTGHTMYYGRGAGGDPTAGAVVSDIAQVALGITSIQFDKLGVWADRGSDAVQLPVENMDSGYYLRITAEDKPGVLAKIAHIFGNYNISICSLLQKDPTHDNSGNMGIPVIITTYPAKEGNLRAALKEVDALDVIKTESVCIQIVDEHPEYDAE